jgi:hypothetical protein
MIELLSASFIGQDAGLVVLEDLLIAFDRDGDRLLRHGGLESALRLIHVGVTSHIARLQDFGATT